VHFAFRPHRMHETQTIAIDYPGRLSVFKTVSLSVCLSRGFAVRCSNTAEQTRSCLWLRLRDPTNIALNGSLDFPTDSMRPSTNYFAHLFTLIAVLYEFSRPRPPVLRPVLLQQYGESLVSSIKMFFLSVGQ